MKKKYKYYILLLSIILFVVIALSKHVSYKNIYVWYSVISFLWFVFYTAITNIVAYFVGDTMGSRVGTLPNNDEYQENRFHSFVLSILIAIFPLFWIVFMM